MNFPTQARRWLKLPYVLAIRHRRMKKPFRMTYVLIHGIADTGDIWQPLIKQLPEDVNYIAVDLLGHGASPFPAGDTIYSASEQARNVMATCLRAGLSGPVIVIGHSFGALVATEFAYHYKGLVRQLVLVSPPIYRDETKEGGARLKQETLLRSIYTQFLNRPEMVIKSYALARKLKAAGITYTVLDKDNYAGFANTLKSGIMSQRASMHLLKTRVPTTILYGRFDPVIVPQNLKVLVKTNPKITVKAVASAHGLGPALFKGILRALPNSEHAAPAKGVR